MFCPEQFTCHNQSILQGADMSSVYTFLDVPLRIPTSGAQSTQLRSRHWSYLQTSTTPIFPFPSQNQSFNLHLFSDSVCVVSFFLLDLSILF